MQVAGCGVVSYSVGHVASIPVSAAHMSLLLLSVALAWWERPPPCDANLVVVATIARTHSYQPKDSEGEPKTSYTMRRSEVRVEGLLHDPEDLAGQPIVIAVVEGASERPEFERGQRWLLFLNRRPGQENPGYSHWIALEPRGPVPRSERLQRLYRSGCST
ncbi:MAG: hypothetical protein ACI9VR_003312 [Cognaticolwellia sp.]|jgi:hypothetical protein